jgi:hypothetical protein
MEKSEIRIATPCTLDWSKMTPRDGGRFCGDCKKVVRDLSSMTEREARELVRAAGDGQLCVRFVYDKHGRIFFAGDRARDLVPASLLSRAKRAAVAAAAVAVPLALQGCSDANRADGGGYEHVMGGAVYQPIDGAAEEPGDLGDASAPDADDSTAADPDAGTTKTTPTLGADAGAERDAAPKQ